MRLPRSLPGNDPVTPPMFGGWLRHLRPRSRENVLDRTKALAGAFQLIGWQNSLRAVRYAVRRTWLDRQLEQPSRTPPRVPGRLTGAEPVAGGARFTFAPTQGMDDDLTLEVRFLAAGGVFVGWDGARPTPSYALADFGSGQAPAASQDTTLAREGDDWKVGTGELSVTVHPAGGLTFRSGGDGHAPPLRQDLPPRWDGSAWTHRSTLDSDAAVLGLGGRSAPLDRRGGTYRLWNSDPGGTYTLGDDPLSLSIPVHLVVADAGTHLAFHDTSFDGTVEVGEQVVTRLSDGPLRYYVFPGPPARALDAYTALTGRPALPPRWALGYHQSRWGYGSESAVRRIVGQFAERDLPLSVIWLDIDHLVDNRPFNVDPQRYPDLSTLTADLAERGIHLVAIADPGVATDRRDPVFAGGLAADVFCRDERGGLATGVVWPGTTVFPDFTASRTREWWSRLYQTYVSAGVAGFWHDMNEPSSFAAWGDGTLPLSTRHDLDGRGGDHREAHNVYALLLNHAGFDGVRRLRPDRRPYLLSRSGFAGLQRYAGTWSGDIGTAWEGLRISLSFTLGLGCSGMPYSGPDIGGFDAHPSAELYVRWFQLASYLPFFRVHCAASLPHREPWAFGPEVLGQVRPALTERYALLPYWYTLAFVAHRTGTPYARPMFWADPADAALRWEDDQFLLGDALLVAPVLAEGVRERTVRLPAGRWYDRRTGIAHDGPGHVTVPAPLDSTPVLVRAGAVLPVERAGSIVLEVYPPGPDDEAGQDDDGAAGADDDLAPGGMLVTDAGDGFAEPVEERFTLGRDDDGRLEVRYSGPAGSLPYDVDWRVAPGRP
ncbi:alpha-glucosidase [Actinopolymorpha cephalotaxi]|uniref:Alpha-glucosidase n=1 Tax=Actinopolymorpha cephalotaxi TaxID=504797 RepID=A0A1I2KHK4_9ACTN|nr:glycoside hydrolase family 31 protein [Actinopolymorpha cephalotaxi]NYH84458.1 alpha-glucosidase [Actinopolymorpha cephalotaxi]SFF66434.1 alpha-glucosidase [Actinopolymorpha cephalotaxi]